ncbi:DNA mismatch repair protein [Sphingobacterium corticis]|uniref:DNA mismatch repair protein n=1 Tax=Sphingobacterium corticis TaxID=1812823 RepID=A0ABW5NJM5_9SPHI
MQFITDKQTLEDLNLPGKYKKNSVFSLFNRTQTFGGERVLETIFSTPYASVEPIRQRTEFIAFVRQIGTGFPIDLDDLAAAQLYHQSDVKISAFYSFAKSLRRRTFRMLGTAQEDTLFQNGMFAATRMLSQLHLWLLDVKKRDKNDALRYVEVDNDVLIEQRNLLEFLSMHTEREDPSLFSIAKMDYLIRGKYNHVLQQAFRIIYNFDAYISISSVANEKGFQPALALEASSRSIRIEDGYHATMPKAIGNPMDYDSEQNLTFLTGANMAGKSTYMKSFGILIYLAHLGFPVPAKRMEFAVRDGLYTSINVSDDLSMGQSHYYAEVMRVKQVAQEVNKGKKLVIIFDELFKGTNVKDAFDATLAITQAFQAHKDCQFLISTHIVEVGEKLRDQHESNIRFSYLPTIMQGHIPTYTYQLESGISADKHGMILIEKEGILTLLENKNA